MGSACYDQVCDAYLRTTCLLSTASLPAMIQCFRTRCQLLQLAKYRPLTASKQLSSPQTRCCVHNVSNQCQLPVPAADVWLLPGPKNVKKQWPFGLCQRFWAIMLHTFGAQVLADQNPTSFESDALFARAERCRLRDS